MKTILLLGLITLVSCACAITGPDMPKDQPSTATTINLKEPNTDRQPTNSNDRDSTEDITTFPVQLGPSGDKPTSAAITPKNGCGGLAPANGGEHNLTEADFTTEVINCLIEMTKTTDELVIIHGPKLDTAILDEIRSAWDVGVKILGNWGPLTATLVEMNDPDAQLIAELDCARRIRLKSHTREDCVEEKTSYFNTFTECCGAVHDPPEPLAERRAQYFTFASIDEMFKDPGEVAKVFLHEYVHVYQNAGAVRPNHLRFPGGQGEDEVNVHGFGPVWIEEGAAEYFATRWAMENGFWTKERLLSRWTEAIQVARDVRQEHNLGLEDVESRGDQRRVREQCDCGGALYYETGMVATGWLMNRSGATAVLDYYMKVPHKPWKQVFKDTYGLSIEDFYKEFGGFLDSPGIDHLSELTMSLKK